MRIGPLYIGGYRKWHMAWVMKPRVGIFRNSPGVRAGRWGFFILGFEFGNRNPGSRFGIWLKKVGLWPW